MLSTLTIRYEAHNELSLHFGQTIVSEFRIDFTVNAEMMTTSGVAYGDTFAASNEPCRGSPYCVLVSCLAGVHGDVPSFVRSVCCAKRSAAAISGDLYLFVLMSLVKLLTPKSCSQTNFRTMEVLMLDVLFETNAVYDYIQTSPQASTTHIPCDQILSSDNEPRRGMHETHFITSNISSSSVSSWLKAGSFLERTATTTALSIGLVAAVGVAASAVALSLQLGPLVCALLSSHS